MKWTWTTLTLLVLAMLFGSCGMAIRDYERQQREWKKSCGLKEGDLVLVKLDRRRGSVTKVCVVTEKVHVRVAVTSYRTNTHLFSNDQEMDVSPYQIIAFASWEIELIKDAE